MPLPGTFFIAFFLYSLLFSASSEAAAL